MESLSKAKLYGIVDLGTIAADDAPRVTAQLIAGGVQILQLRAKDTPPESLLPLAIEMATLCKTEGIPFLINDHASLVSASGATGVHVGQDDLSVAAAREMAGTGAIVGKSTHSLEQARAAADEGADYIGYGPLFATPTKPDYLPIGTRGIREVHAAVSIPIFCIGGIKPHNLESLLACGARRVVLVTGLLLANDIPAVCRACRALLD